MTKISAIALIVMLTFALCSTAFAASHAETTVSTGKILFSDDFSGDIDTEKWDIWGGYAVTDGALHLGHGGSWIESSPIARTVATFKNYFATFKMFGDMRDCYYGFGIRCDDRHNLMNGGRFGVPDPAEQSVGIAFDIFGAGNSTLGEQVGVTFCDNGANGEAPSFKVDRPAGFNPGENAEFKVIDSGSKITVLINGKELVTIELSGLSDGYYTKAAAYDPNGAEVFKGDVSVLEEGTIQFYQRNNHIVVDDVNVYALAEDAPYAPSTLEVDLSGANGSGLDVEFKDGKLVCTTTGADPWVSIPLDNVDTSVYKFFTIKYSATKEIGTNNTYLMDTEKNPGYSGTQGTWVSNGMGGTADGEVHELVYKMSDFPLMEGTILTGVRFTGCNESDPGGVFTIESLVFSTGENASGNPGTADASVIAIAAVAVVALAGVVVAKKVR